MGKERKGEGRERTVLNVKDMDRCIKICPVQIQNMSGYILW